jgi:hypothetical protein
MLLLILIIQHMRLLVIIGTCCHDALFARMPVPICFVFPARDRLFDRRQTVETCLSEMLCCIPVVSLARWHGAIMLIMRSRAVRRQQWSGQP